MNALSDQERDLAEQYLPLAKALARPLKLRYRHLVDEIDSAASLALVLAARAYDPTRQLRFATYCRFRIRGALYRVLDDEGIATDEARIPSRFASKTLDVAAPESPELLDETEAFERWLRPLSPRQAAIIRSIYLDGLTQAEIAETLGISRTEATRLHSQALDLLSGRETRSNARRRLRKPAEDVGPILPAIAC